jgi:DNA replication protein DnaC
MSALKEKARKLGLKTITKNWTEYEHAEWLPPLLAAEEQERAEHAFTERVRKARIGPFKPISEFDWAWPQKIDRDQVEDLFSLEFMREKSNVILLGTNGLGKTMIAKNLAHRAVTSGINTRFIKASDMLNELVECDGSRERRTCLNKFCNVPLLVVDEVGYLSYDTRFADLLYEVVCGRYEKHSTIVTTNKSFGDWGQIFPHAACAVTLVDRLLHKAETIVIEGESFRAKEATERVQAKAKARKTRGKKSSS